MLRQIYYTKAYITNIQSFGKSYRIMCIYRQEV